MNKLCRICGTPMKRHEKICFDCEMLRLSQSHHYNLELERPIYKCIIEGCNKRATKYGVCDEHKRMYLHGHFSTLSREILNDATNGALDAMLSACLPKTVFLSKSSTEVRHESIGEGCVVESELPPFLRDNEIFRTSERGYCSGKYPCCNEVYKEGLCKTHYEMEKGIMHSVDCEEEDTLESKDITIPVTRATSTLRRCATPGCHNITAYTKYCNTCKARK